MHSKASDGKYSPSEVVEQAKLKGLEAIALTDHDSIFGVKEAVLKGKEIGVKVISGIEIDAKYQSGDAKVKDIELLGLNINTAKMQPFADERANARIASLTAYLTAFNHYIKSNEFEAKNKAMAYPLQNTSELSVKTIIDWRNKKDNYSNPAPFLSKMDVVNYAIENFAVNSEKVEKAKSGDRTSLGEFKKEYGFLFEGKESKPNFYEAIAAVKKADGKAVVAHPGLSKGYEHGMTKEWELDESEWFSETAEKLTPYKFIKDLKSHGLDGVEIYFYSGSDKPHAASQDLINKYFSKMAEKLNLITTFGSDCHGKSKQSEAKIGKFGSDKLYLKELGAEQWQLK